MKTEDYKEIAQTIPKQPGVYRFIDKDDEILYVGKAKVLRNRVASYFGSTKGQAFRTRTMVKHARSIEFTVVETEQDALLLENTLIKKFQPRYNVMLKDGKSYAYLCIKKEPFPRVFFTRKIIKDGSKYFGPYTSKWKTTQIFEIIKKLFQLRTCNLQLSAKNIEAEKFKVCLEYHLKNCKGPCVGKESEEEYNKKIGQIKNILEGNFKPVKDYIKSEMQRHAERLEFEEADIMKEKLTLFEAYQSKSMVVSMSIKDVDVFSIHIDDEWAYINYLKVVNGAIINTDTVDVKMNLDDKAEDILSYVIPEIREKYNSIAPEILLHQEVELASSDAKVTIPQIGDKRKLLDLSLKNVKYYMLQKKKSEASSVKKQTPAERILKTLQSDLSMDEVPIHIECFDNSNIQGAHPTASCVVFRNAKPFKKDYRHFNIKTVIGPDDFASMTEIVLRRYSRLLKEESKLPQLIIIDGGKGQLSSAMKSIRKLGIEDRVTVIGIAKKLEEIFFPDDSVPIYINKKSESLKLIQQARNEAHRFAITFHRTKRSQFFTTSELEHIPGIGEKTAETLLTKFGSTKRIREASIEDIATLIGNQKAKLVVEGLTQTDAKK
ncbi:MAG: excinuclease ABC subunit C [Saprospiraceae bacterium]